MITLTLFGEVYSCPLWWFMIKLLIGSVAWMCVGAYLVRLHDEVFTSSYGDDVVDETPANREIDMSMYDGPGLDMEALDRLKKINEDSRG